MQYVRFYCGLRTPLDEDVDALRELSDFRLGIEDCLQELARVCVFEFEWHDPIVEPPSPYLVQPSEAAPEEAYMQLDVEMQYFRLEHALLRVNLLKSLMENLCYKQGIYPSFEYHLDEDPD